SDCSSIVSTRCNANPFELTTVTSANLCDEVVYPRLAFCRNTDREHGDKASNCMEAIGLACTADRFAQKTGTTGGNLCDADHAADLAFCLDNSKDAPNKMMNCVGTRQTACVNNPFDALCINEYSTNDMEKLTFCRDPSKTPADKPTNCSGELIETACVANPFDTLCIGTYLVSKTDKLAFCRDTDREPAGKEYTCAGTTTLIMNACFDNPFDTLCSDLILGNTANKLQFCRGIRTHVDKVMNCSGELIRTACNANPFDRFCVGEYKKTDTEKLAFCRAAGTSQLLRTAHCTSGELAKLACSVNVYDTLCVGSNFNDAAEVEFCRDTDRPHADKAENCGASLAVRAVCRTNPFTKTTGTTVGNFCDETTYPRLVFCSNIDQNAAVRNANCGDTITNACDANPFEKTNSNNRSYTPVYLCAGNYITDGYRLAFCRDPSRNTNNLPACAGTIMTACNANPFEKKTGGGNLCDETTYDRLAFCRGDIAHDDKATNCSGQLITNACDTNPFDTLCTGDYLTYDHRLTFCRDTDKQPAGKDDDCMGTIDTACLADRFAQTTGGTPTNLCPSDHAADLVFCNNGDTKTPTQTTQCSFVRTVCPNNPFDSRCSVDIVARVAFCRLGTNATDIADCMGTIAGVCTANPFDTLCNNIMLGNDENKLAFCLDTDRTPDTKTADCMGMISTACDTNPFEQQTGSAAANLCDEATYPRLAFCSNPSRLHADKDTLCQNTITNACNINPFEKTTGGATDDLCPEAYLTQPHREAFCRESRKQTPTKPNDCSAILATICLNNPFEKSSTNLAVALCTHTEAILEAFCRDTSKTPRFKQSNCLNTYRRICETADNPPDPFEYVTYCDGITLTTQLEFCRVGQLANDNAANGETFREMECNEARRLTCEGNPNNRFCLDDNARAVTIGDWLRSFDAPLAKSSAAQSKGHQFLEIDSNVTRYNATHLNLGNAMFDNLP
ncbi:MAG: hypothetical protein K8953_08685, partial [Proteobacteria bacterium]|nr:hypothetical protein [Pseudomonadota bacterium]